MNVASRRRASLALLTVLTSGVGCQQSDTRSADTAAGSASAALPAKVSPALAGNWTVVGHHIPGLSALNDAEATAWRGRQVRLGASQASADGDVCDAPTYDARSVAKDSLLGIGFKLREGSLPLLDSLERLTVLEVSCAGTPWVAFGGLLIRVEDNRALSPWDGVFFELTRDPDFRALGQEPFWRLEIYGSKQIRFERLGAPTVVTPVPVPQIDGTTGARTYHAITEASDLRVVIAPVPCVDSMSGQSFEMTVTVSLGVQVYHGCGATYH